MARRKQLRRSIHARLTIEDYDALHAMALSDGASVGNVIRDMIRRERIRRDWAERDNMIEVENAAANRGAA